MAKSPNTNPANDNWSLSAKWTQPYLPTSYNPFYTPAPSPLDQHNETLNLLYDLECIDEQVDEMLTYPDAERIINRIIKQRGTKDV